MKENNFEKNIELQLTDSFTTNDNNLLNNKNNIKYNDLQLQPIIINSHERYKINETDTLFGNNYVKYYLKNNLNQSPKKMGNFYTFFFYKNEPMIAIGFKSIKLVLVYEFILQASFLILMNTIINGVFSYMKYMLIIFYLNSFLYHMYIFLSNPGIPTHNHFHKIILNQKGFNKKDHLFCDVCNIIIKENEGVEHCDECGICMGEYDHHCYWCGKCIAKNNSIAFFLFWLGAIVYIVWYFMIIIVWLILKMNEYKKKIKNI